MSDSSDFYPPSGGGEGVDLAADYSWTGNHTWIATSCGFDFSDQPVNSSVARAFSLIDDRYTDGKKGFIGFWTDNVGVDVGETGLRVILGTGGYSDGTRILANAELDNVQIVTDSNAVWKFEPDGALILPEGTVTPALVLGSEKADATVQNKIISWGPMGGNHGYFGFSNSTHEVMKWENLFGGCFITTPSGDFSVRDDGNIGMPNGKLYNYLGGVDQNWDTLTEVDANLVGATGMYKSTANGAEGAHIPLLHIGGGDYGMQLWGGRSNGLWYRGLDASAYQPWEEITTVSMVDGIVADKAETLYEDASIASTIFDENSGEVELGVLPLSLLYTAKYRLLIDVLWWVNGTNATNHRHPIKFTAYARQGVVDTPILTWTQTQWAEDDKQWDSKGFPVNIDGTFDSIVLKAEDRGGVGTPTVNVVNGSLSIKYSEKL